MPLASAVEVTDRFLCRVNCEIDGIKRLTETEHGLGCCIDVTVNMRPILVRHLRAVPGDLVSMDASFLLPQKYQASANTPAYLHVRRWRVVDATAFERPADASTCIRDNFPYGAERGNVRLEAVDMSCLQKFACQREIPTVWLHLQQVPVQPSLDDLSRLCFLHRTQCTVCCVGEGKHKSLEACTRPGDKRHFAMLCDRCLKQLFVVVQKCPKIRWWAPKWVRKLEAKGELYFFSSVQEKVGVFGHLKTPKNGVYALKSQSALAQVFDSWAALSMRRCRRKSAKRTART